MTKHQLRQQELRTRLQRVVKHIDTPTGRGLAKVDGYTMFASRMVDIASKNNLSVSRQRQELKDGTPKDLPTSIRAFALGKVGLVSSRLDVIELTCIELEREHREARAAARAAEAAQAATLAVVEPEKPVQAATATPELDAELVAMAEVIAALRLCHDGKARERVVHWALDKIDSEEANIA